MRQLAMEPLEIPGLVLVHSYEELRSWMVVGLGFPDLMLGCYWLGLVLHTGGCGFQGVPKLVLTHC